MIAMRKLGDTAVSRIGFGAGPIGGFRGPVDSVEAEAAMAAYLNAGGRYFDTSPLYGYGRSELRVGAFLREQTASAQPPAVISTKIGRVFRVQRAGDDLSTLRHGGLPFWPRFDYSYDGAMRSLEQSSLRTGLTRFDIVLVHDLEPGVHGADFQRQFDTCMDGAYRALRELRDAGDILAIGVGVNQSEAARAFVEAGDFDCVMLAGCYSLLDHDLAVLSFFELCQDKGVGILAAGVFNSGILATGAGASASYGYRPANPAIKQRVRAIQQVCAEFDVDLPAAAIQFVLAHPVVASVVLGSSSATNVQQNLAHAGKVLPTAFWRKLADAGLLPMHLTPEHGKPIC
ncbi:aldo/keto reductase [Piscinibacter sakaiensis]|uniref:aldo/keto reductase n=1 Tax=Piscinibacter sakaiensis TaxID=1547922 RepID=UPI003AB100BD